MKRFLAYSLFFVAAITKLWAQHDNTLFYMDKVPQHHYMNPALTPDCKWWLSLGLPSVHMDLNSPFSYHDIIMPGIDSAKADSTILFLYNKETQKNFLDGLDEINYLTMNFQFTYLYFGFKAGKNTFTFDLSDRGYIHASIPKDLFELVLFGNADKREANINGLTLEENFYHELALGYKRKIGRYLRLGLRGKFLVGVSNFHTAKSEVEIQTAELTNEISAKANYTIQTNYPIESVGYDPTNTYINDITFPKLNFAANDYYIDKFLWTNNYGWGVDIGLANDWNSELSYYVSLVDFGFIQWDENSSNFKFEGDSAYVYRGVEITSINLDSLKLIPTIEEITNGNQTQYEKGSYRTWLPMKIYGGLKYKLHKRINIGLLGRFEKLEHKWLNAYTASLNFNIFKYGNISLSYSYNNDSWSNIGWGYTIRIGAVQWYFVGDNAIGTKIFPAEAQNLNMRFGFNYLFGRDKRSKKLRRVPLLNTL